MGLADREAESILPGRSARALAVLAVVLAFTFAPPDALADESPPPVFDGIMTFPSIQSPSGPEDYSWQVNLGEEQEMELVDEKTIEVFYVEGHHYAFGFQAEPAHDADGTAVPTSLSMPEKGNVFTLTVHHRAGNPAADGAPFHYPIIAGAGWEGGFHTVEILGPPASEGTPAPHCVVPRLRGRSLSAAHRLLKVGGCSLGTVRHIRKDATGSPKVVAQRPKPGVTRRRGAVVNLTLR